MDIKSKPDSNKDKKEHKNEKVNTEAETTKLAIKSELEKILKNPSKHGLTSFDDIAKARNYEAVAKNNENLSDILSIYFGNQMIIKSSGNKDREVALTMFYLSQQKDTKGKSISVNYLKPKWKVEIKGARLFITSDKGELLVDGAYLRKPKTSTEKQLSKLKQSVAVQPVQAVPNHRETLTYALQGIYYFDSGKYSPSKIKRLKHAVKAIEKNLQNAKKDQRINVVILGTADYRNYKVDRKGQVILNYSSIWQNDFLKTFKILKGSGALPELANLDFDKDGIYAIHKLSRRKQQKAMNHALAYLRGESLKAKLEEKFKDKNVDFTIKTKWLSSSTRVATMDNADFRKKLPPKPKPKPAPGPLLPPAPLPIPMPAPAPAPAPAPKPAPPEKFKPSDMIEELSNLESAKYKISKTATLTGGWYGKSQRMGMGRYERTTKSGIDVYNTLFVLDKSSPGNNPNYYVCICRSNPYRILIGEMNYRTTLIQTKAYPGKIIKVINLDKSSTAATKASMQQITSYLDTL